MTRILYLTLDGIAIKSPHLREFSRVKFMPFIYFSETNTLSSAPSSVSGSTAAASTAEQISSSSGTSFIASAPTCVYLMSRTALHLDIEETPTANCDIILNAIANCDELGLNKQLASQVFSLWMVSPLLGEKHC